MQEAEVSVSITSAYDKLGNLPLAVNETLLQEGTHRERDPARDPGRWPAAKLLGECEVYGADGKTSSMSNDCLSRYAGHGRAYFGVRRWA